MPRISKFHRSVALILIPLLVSQLAISSPLAARVSRPSPSYPAVFSSQALAAAGLSGEQGHIFQKGLEIGHQLRIFRKPSVLTLTYAGVTTATVILAVLSHLGSMPQTLTQVADGLSVALASVVPFVPFNHSRWILGLENRPDHPHNERFYAQLVEDVGGLSSDWARMGLVASAILELRRPGNGHTFTADDIRDASMKKLSAHGIPLADVPGQSQNDQFNALMKKLMVAGVLVLTDQTHYQLTQLPRAVAVKFKLVDFIHKDIQSGLSGKSDLQGLCQDYGSISDRWSREPVESRWPFMQAVSLLDAAQQNKLIRFIEHHPDLRDYAAIDGAWLMLGQSPGENWLQKHAPHLIGRTIYTVAAEGWYPAGGLGRVQQYHSTAMAILTAGSARVATIEPYYPENYDHLPKPEGWHEVEGFDVPFIRTDGKPHSPHARVFTYKREVAPNVYVDVYVIRDRGDELGKTYYTNKRYVYDQLDSANYHDFSEFFARASIQLMERLETERSAQENYKPGVIIANDGQLGHLPQLLREDPEFQKSSILANMLVAFVTHTYGNRGPGIKEWYDPTSLGLAYADLHFAVSAIHRHEMSRLDPDVKEVATTNGDRREATRQVFLNIWNDLFRGEDHEHPTAFQIRDLKREAKKRFKLVDPLDDPKDPKKIKELLRRLGLKENNPYVLDPERPVICYSGRMVGEKSGRNRAFTDTNLERLVKAGAQVVLYTNAQGWMGDVDRLIEVAHRLNTKGYPGRLIVRSGWSLDDQRALLAAADVQVQDSHRGTEAAGYTEADISSVGGLQVGPDYAEGIIQLQGVLLDRTQPGVGNTLIPLVKGALDGLQGDINRQDGYWDVFKWAIDHFNDDRENFTKYQATSVRLSRHLEALAGTGPEYLRQLSAGVELLENPLEGVRRYVYGLRESAKFFSKIWQRRRLLAQLKAYVREDQATPLRTGNGTVEAYVVHLKDSERPFIVAVDTSRNWSIASQQNPKVWTNISWEGNEEAFRKLFPNSADPKNELFQVWDAGERTLFDRHHQLSRDGQWSIGVPYPGIQVLTTVPVLAPSDISGLKGRTDLKVQTFGKYLRTGNGLEQQKVVLQDVPDIPVLQKVLNSDRSIREALDYLVQPRPPSRRGGGRVILQVPIRFLGGGWETKSPDFNERLKALLRMIHLPRGSYIHLIGSQPTSPLSDQINSKPGDDGIYTATLASTENSGVRGTVMVRQDPPVNAPGRAASIFAVTDLAQNLPYIRQTSSNLRTQGYHAMVDLIGHLAPDSHWVAEHPEWFKPLSDSPFRSGIPPLLTDREVMTEINGRGAVYAFPYSDHLAMTLRSRPGASWGERSDEEGRRWIRFVLEHHETGYGPMPDTIALDFSRPDVQTWYIEQGKLLVEAGADGFRVDLAQYIGDEFLATVKTQLRLEAEKHGRDLAFVLEDYRNVDDKIKSAQLNQNSFINAYHNNWFFETFRQRFFKWSDFPKAIRAMAPALSSGHLVNYTSNHDELTTLGRLYGRNRLPEMLALMTSIFTMAGPVLIRFEDLFGWLWYKEDGSEPEDIWRQMTAEKYSERAAKESSHPIDELVNLMTVSDHAILRDGVDVIPLDQRNASFCALARPYLSARYGKELEVTVINFNESEDPQSDTVEMPLDLLGVDPAATAPSYFMVRDLVSNRVNLYTGEELKKLHLTLKRFEPRIFLIRQIANKKPSKAFLEVFEQIKMESGFKAFSDVTKEPATPRTLPWAIPAQSGMYPFWRRHDYTVEEQQTMRQTALNNGAVEMTAYESSKLSDELQKNIFRDDEASETFFLQFSDFHTPIMRLIEYFDEPYFIRARGIKIFLMNPEALPQPKPNDPPAAGFAARNLETGQLEIFIERGNLEAALHEGMSHLAFMDDLEYWPLAAIHYLATLAEGALQPTLTQAIPMEQTAISVYLSERLLGEISDLLKPGAAYWLAQFLADVPRLHQDITEKLRALPAYRRGMLALLTAFHDGVYYRLPERPMSGSLRTPGLPDSPWVKDEEKRFRNKEAEWERMSYRHHRKITIGKGKDESPITAYVILDDLGPTAGAHWFIRANRCVIVLNDRMDEAVQREAERKEYWHIYISQNVHKSLVGRLSVPMKMIHRAASALRILEYSENGSLTLWDQATLRGMTLEQLKSIVDESEGITQRRTVRQNILDFFKLHPDLPKRPEEQLIIDHERSFQKFARELYAQKHTELMEELRHIEKALGISSSQPNYLPNLRGYIEAAKEVLQSVSHFAVPTVTDPLLAAQDSATRLANPGSALVIVNRERLAEELHIVAPELGEPQSDLVIAQKRAAAALFTLQELPALAAESQGTHQPHEHPTRTKLGEAA